MMCFHRQGGLADCPMGIYPIAVIFWNHGVGGRTRAKSWIERGCGQNLESKGDRAANSEGRSRNAEVNRVRAELSLLARVDEATSMTERQIRYIPTRCDLWKSSA